MANATFGKRTQSAKDKAKATTALASKMAAQVPAPAPEPTETEVPVYSPKAYKDLDIGEYRGRFAEETKALTDKQLFDIVAATTDDLDDDGWRSLFSARANPNAPDGDTLAEHAKELGSKASDAMGETLERLAKAREDWQGGPIYTLLSLRATYSEEELDTFPVPGSETGTNPDKFSISTIKGDKKGHKKTTFYRQFTLGTPYGSFYVNRLEMLDRAADKGAIKDGIDADILEMSPDGRSSHRSFCENRLNTITQAHKKALELHQKLAAVNAYAENIVASPIWEDGKSPDDVDNIMDAEVVATAEPIAVWIVEEGKPITKWEPFSIAAFLKLNPAKALEKGGGFKNLVESGATKKAPPPPGQAEKTDIVIKTTDRGLGIIVEFHRWMAEIASAKDGAEYGKLVQSLTAKGNDEYVTAFVELKNYMIDTAKNNGLDAKYIKLKQSGSALVSDVTVPEKAAVSK